jgi:hypothetical protein
LREFGVTKFMRDKGQDQIESCGRGEGYLPPKRTESYHQHTPSGAFVAVDKRMTGSNFLAQKSGLCEVIHT